MTVNRGGGRGRIYENDPTLNTGHAEGDAYRRAMLDHPEGVFHIDPKKARLGLENDSDSFFRFNQQLMEKNPAAYEEARPWASGKTARQFFTKIPKSLAQNAYSGVSGLYDNIVKPKLDQLMNTNIVKDARGLTGAWDDLKNIGQSNDLSTKYNDYNKEHTGQDSTQWMTKKKRDAPFSTETSDLGNRLSTELAEEILFGLDDNIESELAEAIMSGRDFANPGGSMLPSDTINTRIGVLTGNQQSDRERKIQFIREATGGSYDILPSDDYSDEHVDYLYEKMKRRVGKGISEDRAEERVNIFDPTTDLEPMGNSYNIDLEKAQKEAADMNNPYKDYDSAFIRDKLPFKKPDKGVTPELLDSWSMENIMETNPAYDVFTDDQKIQLQENLQNQSLFAGGGYAEPYAGGGTPKKNIYDLLKSYNETAYEK